MLFNVHGIETQFSINNIDWVCNGKGTSEKSVTRISKFDEIIFVYKVNQKSGDGMMSQIDLRQMLFNVHGIETQFPLSNSNPVCNGKGTSEKSVMRILKFDKTYFCL